MSNKRNKILLSIIVLLLPLNLFISSDFLSVFFNKKVWKHKVNDIEKLDDSIDFSGIECDVVFMNGYFDIHHPPESQSGFLLADIFNIASVSNKNLKYWLDFKNLDSTNWRQSLKKLNELSDHFNIDKTNIIVESTNIRELVNFHLDGYQTSFYLPNDFRFMDSEQKERIVSETSPYPFLLISSDYRNRYEMNKSFKGHPKIYWCSDIWFPFGAFGLGKIYQIYDLLFDSNSKILLLP